MRTARAKGVPERRILFRHVLRNSLIPIITLLGLSLPVTISGAVIVEAVFNYPGMGLLFWTAATTQDYPVLMGFTIVVAAAAVFGQPDRGSAVCRRRPTGAPGVMRRRPVDQCSGGRLSRRRESAAWASLARDPNNRSPSPTRPAATRPTPAASGGHLAERGPGVLRASAGGRRSGHRPVRDRVLFSRTARLPHQSGTDRSRAAHQPPGQRTHSAPTPPAMTSWVG